MCRGDHNFDQERVSGEGLASLIVGCFVLFQCPDCPTCPEVGSRCLQKSVLGCFSLSSNAGFTRRASCVASLSEPCLMIDMRTQRMRRRLRNSAGQVTLRFGLAKPFDGGTAQDRFCVDHILYCCLLQIVVGWCLEHT